MNIHEYLNQTEEKPLENIVENGGYTSIFRKIACIGDSLSSGEFQIIKKKTCKKTHKYKEAKQHTSQITKRSLKTLKENL